MRSENDFYYSNDEGLTWQRLFHFNRNLQGVTKFVAFDTSFAAALINNNAINDEFYIIRSGENEWQKVDLDINTREFSVLQYSKKNCLALMTNGILQVIKCSNFRMKERHGTY